MMGMCGGGRVDVDMWSEYVGTGLSFWEEETELLTTHRVPRQHVGFG